MPENQNYHPSSDTHSRFFYGYIIVASALLIMILAYGIRTSFGVFFKPMSNEFEWTRALTSGAVTLSMLIQGLWGILMGKINDKVGSRWVISICCFFSGLGFLLLSFTNSAWQLYIFYGLIIGIGMGGIFVALVSTIARWFVKRRGLMTGIVLSGIGIGTLIMVPLSNWLILIYDWRHSYFIIGLLVLVIGVLAAQFLRRDPTKMGSLPYGQIDEKRSIPSSDSKGLSFREAVLTYQFWMVAVAFICVGYCTFTITVHLVPHITDLGISASSASNILAATGAVSSIGGVILGIIADRIGSRRILIISFVLVTASLFWLISINTVLIFYLFAALHSFGVGGGTAMESTLVAELFGLKAHGLILGAVSFGFTIGAALGPLITGYLFDLNGNYRAAFLLCAVLGVAGLVLTAIIRPIKRLEDKT